MYVSRSFVEIIVKILWSTTLRNCSLHRLVSRLLNQTAES